MQHALIQLELIFLNIIINHCEVVALLTRDFASK